MKVLSLAITKAKQRLKKSVTRWEIRRCESVMWSKYSSQQEAHNAAVRLFHLKEQIASCGSVNFTH